MPACLVDRWRRSLVLHALPPPVQLTCWCSHGGRYILAGPWAHMVTAVTPVGKVRSVQHPVQAQSSWTPRWTGIQSSWTEAGLGLDWALD